MLHELAVQNMRHQFTAYAGQGACAIVWVAFWAFLKMDAIFALCQSSGRTPWSYDCRKMKLSTGAICTEASLRALYGILSGLVDFEIFKFFQSSSVSITEKSTLAMSKNGFRGMSGILLSTLVKALWNWLAKTYAFPDHLLLSGYHYSSSEHQHYLCTRSWCYFQNPVLHVTTKH